MRAHTRVGNSTRRALLGEADHWTEGFADALADDMEGRVEDLGSAGIAMAAMDNVARRHETKVAKAKLAAAHAFHEAVSSAQPLDVCSHDRSLTPARWMQGVAHQQKERGQGEPEPEPEPEAGRRLPV